MTQDPRVLSVTAAALPGIPEVQPGDDLAALILAVSPADLADGDVLVITSKVVSKAEGRVVSLAAVTPGEEARRIASQAARKDPRLVQLVLDESAEVLRAERGVLIVETHHGFVCANAGIDQSNVPGEEQALLLPLDPDGSARTLREAIERERGVRPAVVISDSFGRAWRVGQVDVAIGVAGLSPLEDWRGRRDPHGRELHATLPAIADAVSAAADLARDKDTGEPVVLVRGLERFVTPDDGPGAAALRRPRSEDLFR
jgi:coenzyme F420-0:L-glutamate ligase / coenzyme F420-1:gamma-L-glutamate ligase